jgi:hypothetical protein
MGIDLNNDYEKAKTKINSFKTVAENKKTEIYQKKLKKPLDSFDKKKSDVTKQINELKTDSLGKVNKVKEKVKNQLEQLLDLFKSSLPKSGSKSMSTISKLFLTAAEKTKEQLKDILIDEIISTIDCSEEQSYENKIGQPIYIKVEQIDLFKRLKYSPEDKTTKHYYEKNKTVAGVVPNAFNRALYERLDSLGQSYETQYGMGYVGRSGQQLFDVEYVQFYPETNPTNFGDFFKVTLKQQANSVKTVSEFLVDYYGSIEILNFKTLSTEIMNSLTGAIDFSAGITSDGLREEKKFDLILKRIMGICNDPNKKIDVSGTAKLNDEQYIDDSFFDVSNQELRSIERDINLTINGLVEYESCDGVTLPINVDGTLNVLDEITNHSSPSAQIEALIAGIDKIPEDPNWKNLIPSIGIDINLKSDFDFNLITKLPKLVYRTVLSPKVLFGMMVMIKAVSNPSTTGGSAPTSAPTTASPPTAAPSIDNINSLQSFSKFFKKFTIGFMTRVSEIFIKELFAVVKSNIRELVDIILMDIIKEAKSKQLAMYAAIIYVLLTVGQAIIDYRNCKSVIDEILKLLNLGMSKLNLGLPLFALFGAKFLPGISDTRSFANVIENMQKLGLPTGDAPDGGPNMMNAMLKAQIKGANLEIAENGKVELAIPSLEVITPPFGGPGKTIITKGFGKLY